MNFARGGRRASKMDSLMLNIVSYFVLLMLNIVSVFSCFEGLTLMLMQFSCSERFG